MSVWFLGLCTPSWATLTVQCQAAFQWSTRSLRQLHRSQQLLWAWASCLHVPHPQTCLFQFKTGPSLVLWSALNPTAKCLLAHLIEGPIEEIEVGCGVEREQMPLTFFFATLGLWCPDHHLTFHSLVLPENSSPKPGNTPREKNKTVAQNSIPTSLKAGSLRPLSLASRSGSLQQASLERAGPYSISFKT